MQNVIETIGVMPRSRVGVMQVNVELNQMKANFVERLRIVKLDLLVISTPEEINACTQTAQLPMVKNVEKIRHVFQGGVIIGDAELNQLKANHVERLRIVQLDLLVTSTPEEINAYTQMAQLPKVKNVERIRRVFQGGVIIGDVKLKAVKINHVEKRKIAKQK